MKIRIIFCFLILGLSSTLIANYSNIPLLECQEGTNVDEKTPLDSLSIDQLECVLYRKIERNPNYETLKKLLEHFNKKRTILQNESKYVDSKQITVLMLHAWKSIDSLHQYSLRLTTLAYYHFRLGEIFDCYSYGLQALEIARENKFLDVEERALSRLAWSDWRIKRYDEAIKYNDERYPIIFNIMKDDNKKYAWFNSAGKFYKEIGDYPKAQFYGDSAIYYAIKLKQSRAVSLTKSNMCSYYKGTDSMAYRMELINESLAINLRNNNKEQLGSNLGLKAWLESLQKKYKDAERNYKLSLEFSIEIGDKPRQRIAYDGLAIIYDSLGMYQKALYYQKKGSGLDEELYGGASLQRFFDLEQSLSQKENKRLKAEKEVKDLRIEQDRNNFQVVTLLFVLVGLGIWFYFSNKIKNQKIKRERLEELHKISIKNLEMESLRSQMNPHFIFNSLNSIKGYISSNEPRVATRFLNKFSKLIRMILSHSKQKRITLKEEIVALKLYIELENLRLSDALEYDLTIKEEIDTESLQIPPLIIQPFVENAIWHGLALSKRKKFLEIIIQKEGENIAIKIIDNGIGRAASKKRQRLKENDHKSFGIDITKGRIALANKNNTSLVDDKVYFKDIILADGSPGGTEVTILLKP